MSVHEKIDKSSNDGQYNDSFRYMEKSIRNYTRRSILERSTLISKKQKKRQLQEQGHGKWNTFEWSEILDVSANLSNTRIARRDLDFNNEMDNDLLSQYLPPLSDELEVHDLSAKVSPGLFLIRNALSVEAQLFWAKRSLEVYSLEDHTNLTNLSNQQAVESIINNSSSAVHISGVPGTADRKSNIAVNRSVSPEPAGEQSYLESDINSRAICSSTLGANGIHNNCPAAAPVPESLWAQSCRDDDGFQGFSKMRWSCLGYHYDWTNRKYQRNLKSQFPADFAQFCRKLARVVGDDLQPEAAIVNYYPVGTTMGGHIDDAEHDMSRPIVSISIGCSAIFLLGGRDKSIRPTPLLLRSGDVVIMSGESRYAYHGVAYVIPADFVPIRRASCSSPHLPSPPHASSKTCSSHAVIPPSAINTNGRLQVAPLEQPPLPLATPARQSDKLHNIEAFDTIYETADGPMRFVIDYLRNARININVRQVRLLPQISPRSTTTSPTSSSLLTRTKDSAACSANTQTYIRTKSTTSCKGVRQDYALGSCPVEADDFWIDKAGSGAAP